MAQLIEVKDLDLLIDKALAQGGDPAETAAAKAALKTAAQRMGDRDACAAKLAEHLERSFRRRTSPICSNCWAR